MGPRYIIKKLIDNLRRIRYFVVDNETKEFFNSWEFPDESSAENFVTSRVVASIEDFR